MIEMQAASLATLSLLLVATASDGNMPIGSLLEGAASRHVRPDFRTSGLTSGR